jgi:menaquinol-cytochrome c reductase iron-sulfur subunit
MADAAAPSTAEATRRRFLALASGVLSFVGGLIVGVPFLDALVGPAFRSQPRRFARAARLSSLPVGRPRSVSYTDVRRDAYIEERIVRSVWATRHSEKDVTVFSPICPHLGCRYAWQPRSRHFVCPCHGSVFAPDGKVLAGPSPRPLDTLPAKVDQGELLVEWERFEVGVPEKIVV